MDKRILNENLYVLVKFQSTFNGNGNTKKRSLKSTNDFTNKEIGKSIHNMKFTFIYYEDDEEEGGKQKSKYLDCDMITCGAITMELVYLTFHAVRFSLSHTIFNCAHHLSDHWCYN